MTVYEGIVLLLIGVAIGIIWGKSLQRVILSTENDLKADIVEIKEKVGAVHTKIVTEAKTVEKKVDSTIDETGEPVEKKISDEEIKRGLNII